MKFGEPRTVPYDHEPSARERIGLWFRGITPEPIIPWEHPRVKKDGPKSGVCCSGGGIRSAAFNLGALQAMQEQGELQKMDYLAAVSGGSYIAAAHTMVRKETDQPLLQGSPAFTPGSPEERYLRNRTQYLAPGIGGKYYLAWRVLRGIAVNVSMLAGVLIIAGWVVGRALRASIRPVSCVVGNRTLTCVGVHRAAWLRDVVAAIVVLAALAGLFGLFDLVARRREGQARVAEAWSLRLLNLALVGAFVFLALPELIVLLRNYNHGRGLLKGITVGGAGGVALGILAVRAEARTVEQAAKKVSDALKKVPLKLRRLLMTVAVALLGPAAVVATFGVAALEASRSTTRVQLITLAVSAFVILSLWRWGDLTSWSLHPFYRRRLASAFALRRVGTVDDQHAEEVAEPVHFQPWPWKRRWQAAKESPMPNKPQLIVCAAANVSDRGAEPPGRGATSFTFSEDEVGGPLVGTMGTAEYQRLVGKRFEDHLSLFATVAISGAAVSPSMGKLTHRAYTFLLALGNIRLGVWLPNPSAMKRWKDRHGLTPTRHRARPFYLVKELLGATSYRDRFLYVSDGGHYENLGLVQLLARGCTEIYCFDASGDHMETFHTLGQAVSIARSDLGIDVDIDPMPMKPPKEGGYAPQNTVVGHFRREDDPPGKHPGTIVFAKTAVTKDCPWDVLAYYKSDPIFPCHPTYEQLYTDERFEAYRALGYFTAGKAMKAMKAQR
jgi:hypothetical protein